MRNPWIGRSNSSRVMSWPPKKPYVPPPLRQNQNVIVRIARPVGVCVTDVSFDVHFFPSGVHPLLVDVVHPKPRFARWGCNYFKSVRFLQPATLQTEFV